MKTKLLNILSIFMVLFFVTGCGQDSSSSQDNSENRGVVVTVNSPSSYKLVAQKTSNLDLQIDSMKIDVYNADSATDTDYSDNSLVLTQSFTEVDGKWSITLSGLEKAKSYTFVVFAFNASETTKPIFKGSSTATVSTTIKTELNINLEQVYDFHSDYIPTASNIIATKDANGDILLSFTLNNPNENVVTWKIFSEDGTTLSTEFTPNLGTTSDQIMPIEVAYNKTVDLNNTRYVLELNDKDGTTRYLFGIDYTATGENVLVDVNTPPIIKSMSLSFSENTVSLTPELDKESATVSYVWSSTSGEINDASSKTIVISKYNYDNGFEILLEVTDKGASSYRIYYIAPYRFNAIEILDTTNQAVIDVLGVPKEEVDALLAFYKSTNVANYTFNWNSLTPVSDWTGIYVSNGHVKDLRFDFMPLYGIIPKEFANLTELEVLVFNSTKLYGIIPKELSTLTKLTKLFLEGQFTGIIPSELSNLSNLKNLTLRGNLVGIIPNELGQLSVLEYLDLSGNKLTGKIPNSFANLESLKTLYIEQNFKYNNLSKDHSEEVNDWLKDLDYLDDKSFIR